MALLIHAAMVFVLLVMPRAVTSVDTDTPRSVPGYIECGDGQVTVHVLQVLATTAEESRFLERREFERQWLLAADCADNGRVDGSLAPVVHDSPFLEDRAQAWVTWALDHRAEAVTLLETRAAALQ